MNISKKSKLLFLIAFVFLGIILLNGYYELNFNSLATDSGFDTGGGGSSGGGSSGGGSSSSLGGDGTPIPFRLGMGAFLKLFLAMGMVVVANSAEGKKTSIGKKVIVTILFLISVAFAIDCLLFSLTMFIQMLVLDFMITLCYIATMFPPSEEDIKARKLSFYMNDDIVKMLEERDPSLDSEENLKIAEEAYKIYYDIQMAWMNFDYDKLRTLVTDEMFNMYQAQLKTLELKEQQNVMSNFKPIKKIVISREKTNGIETITVLLFVEFFDFIKDKDGKIVSGYGSIKVNVSYLLTYVVNEDADSICPGCGAELSNGETECSYCHTKIQAVGSKLRLAKKEVLEQHY